MTVATATGLTANKQYKIQLFQPSPIDSTDADYLVATTSTVADNGGNLSVSLPPTTGNQYYYGVFDTNTWIFDLPDSGTPLAIDTLLIQPQRTIVEYASVTEVNGQTGVVQLDAQAVAALPNNASLESLSDVVVTNPSTGQVLTIGATGKWVNENSSGGGGVSSLLAYTPFPLNSESDNNFTASWPSQDPSGIVGFVPKDSSNRYPTCEFTAPTSGKAKVTVGFFLVVDGGNASPNTAMDMTVALCSDTTPTVLAGASTYRPEFKIAQEIPPETFQQPRQFQVYVNMTYILDNLTAGQNYTVYLGLFLYTDSTAGVNITIPSNDTPTTVGSGGPAFFLVEAL